MCPHCGNELVRRPRRYSAAPQSLNGGPDFVPINVSTGTLWAVSLGVWAFIAVAATITIYQVYLLTGVGFTVRMVAGMQFSQILAFVPVTPLIFRLAVRHPLHRGDWFRQFLLYAGAGLAFTLGHIFFRGFTPYGYWADAQRHWVSAFWDPKAHWFTYSWFAVKTMFLGSIVDDFFTAYIPIVVIAHAFLFYRRSEQDKLRATQLTGQLSKAHLQTLKSQLQPHFLFNTLHSISSLMLTNVAAADHMMTSLSDLLRMSLEDNGNQLTTLGRELEFLGLYLEIEKARFEDKLHVTFDIAPECLDSLVPHLLLQPLVENAVRHGVSKRSAPGEVVVSAKAKGEKLELWVRDNGLGLRETPDEAFKKGLGLSVTRERLQAFYGEKQECKIRNRAEGGTEVHLCIPFCVDSTGPATGEVGHRYM